MMLELRELLFFEGTESGSEALPVPQFVPEGDYVLGDQVLRKIGQPQPVSPRGAFARLQMLREDEGGRREPTTPSLYRCSIRINDSLLDCQLYLGEGNRLSPGSETGVIILFLVPEHAAELAAGTSFEVWDGKVVG